MRGEARRSVRRVGRVESSLPARHLEALPAGRAGTARRKAHDGGVVGNELKGGLQRGLQHVTDGPCTCQPGESSPGGLVPRRGVAQRRLQRRQPLDRRPLQIERQRPAAAAAVNGGSGLSRLRDDTPTSGRECGIVQRTQRAPREYTGYEYSGDCPQSTGREYEGRRMQRVPQNTAEDGGVRVLSSAGWTTGMRSPLLGS